MAKKREVGNPAKIKDLNDAIVLLNGQAVMHPKKRLQQTPAPKSKRSESASGDEPSRYKLLTPEERETIILMSDADDIVSINTHQRTVITKLRRNPGAKEIDSGFHGATAWATFEMPVALLSFRQPAKRGPKTVAQIAANAAAGARLAASRRRKQSAA